MGAKRVRRDPIDRATADRSGAGQADYQFRRGTYDAKATLIGSFFRETTAWTSTTGLRGIVRFGRRSA